MTDVSLNYTTLNMKFIVFEGLDGSGKTTLIQKLADHLDKSGLPLIKTREPGGTPLGDELRNIILRTDGEAPTARTELLLYEAVRAQHVDLKIKPALAEKKWVLCDRFTASSIAFQAGGRKISLQDVAWLNNFATAQLEPDLNVLLDLTVAESHSRREKRGEIADRMEQEKTDFHERIRQGFIDQTQKSPNKWLVLDASKNPDEIFENLLADLRSKKWLK